MFLLNKVEAQQALDRKVLDWSDNLGLSIVEQSRFLNQCSPLIELAMGYREITEPGFVRFIKLMRVCGPMDRELFLKTLNMMQIAQIDTLQEYWDSE